MGLNPSYADIFTRMVSTYAPSGSSVIGSLLGLNKSNLLQSGVKFGLNVASKLDRSEVANFINRDKKNTIRLLFPNLDFGYSYKKDYHNFLYKWFDEEEFQHNRRPREGHLIPSWLVTVGG